MKLHKMSRTLSGTGAQDVQVYIGIGSNLGDRQKNIELAIEKLRQTPGIQVRGVSAIIETEPVGGPPQGKFLNGAIEILTGLPPRQLLSCLKGIEDLLGRKRKIPNGPRTIDLDILLYGLERIEEPDLKVPHPRMRERDFVVEPLKQLGCPFVANKIQYFQKTEDR